MLNVDIYDANMLVVACLMQIRSQLLDSGIPKVMTPPLSDVRAGLPHVCLDVLDIAIDEYI